MKINSDKSHLLISENEKGTLHKNKIRASWYPSTLQVSFVDNPCKKRIKK